MAHGHPLPIGVRVAPLPVALLAAEPPRVADAGHVPLVEHHCLPRHCSWTPPEADGLARHGRPPRNVGRGGDDGVVTGPEQEASPRLRGRDPGLTDRAVRWEEFKQRCRAHRPSELLRVLAAIAADAFDGRAVRPTASGWNPWAIAAVARESLAYGNEHRSAPVTDAALARLLAAHNDLDDPFVRDPATSPWDMVLRTVYQQLGWQASVFGDLARFAAVLDRDFPPGAYEVLSRQAVNQLLGAPLRDFHATTVLLTVAAQRNQGLCDLRWFGMPHFEPVTDVVPAETIRRVFRDSFAAPLAEVAARARAGRHPDPALRVHDLNPLVTTPYVGLTADVAVAPLPRLVADKASLASVYHRGRAEWGDRFTRDLGRLVETYTGEQLALLPGAVLTGERTHGKGSLSVDWIIALPRLNVLVEVKSARVNQASRLAVPAFTADVAADVGKGLGQIARTAQLVRSAHPAFADVSPDRPLRGIVVTAEPHHLINSPLYRKGLPDPTVPTTVLSLGELEHAVAFALAGDPEQVLVDLTDWRDTVPVNVSETFARWGSERGADGFPHNPIIRAAWDRLPWKEADVAKRRNTS